MANQENSSTSAKEWVILSDEVLQHLPSDGRPDLTFKPILDGCHRGVCERLEAFTMLAQRIQRLSYRHPNARDRKRQEEQVIREKLEKLGTRWMPAEMGEALWAFFCKVREEAAIPSIKAYAFEANSAHELSLRMICSANQVWDECAQESERRVRSSHPGQWTGCHLFDRNWLSPLVIHVQMLHSQLRLEYNLAVAALIERQKIVDAERAAAEEQTRSLAMVAATQSAEADSEALLLQEIQRLNEKERNCIQALYEKGIIGSHSENVVAQREIAHWVGVEWDTTFKQALSTTVKAGFLDNMKYRGGRGGYFLTSKGERAGKLIKFQLS